MAVPAALTPLLAAVKASPQLAPLLAATGLNTASPEVLAGALFGAALAVILLLRTLLGSLFGRKDLPPVLACGVPVVGGFIKFLRGPLPMMATAYKKHGQVFTVPLFHRRVTFLIGPEVSSHFYKGTDVQMSQKEVYEFNVPTFGKGVVFDVGHQERAEQFRFFSEALKTARLQTYVQLMVQEAEAFFKERLKADSGEVDLRALLSDLIILTASRTLMGREVREHLFDRVADLFHDLDMGMQPISVIFPYLPIAAHRKRDASRAELARIFTKVIRNRKAAAEKEKPELDVLQAFIDARYKDGRALTEDQITGMLIAVLFAGQHTSSITSTWTGLFLMADKVWYNKCCAEQQAVRAKNGPELNYDVLAQMDTLHVCIKEALRLHPPLIMLMRQSHEDFTVTDKDGRTYTVPKGDIVATSPTFSHRLEHVWTEPNTYNPARHMPGSTDGQKPFSFVGFGGGRHGCMGETFAYMQIKTIWSVLLRNFDFDMVSPFPEPDYDSMVVGPKPPCIVRYKRRALA